MKVHTWPPCKNVIDVYTFLSMARTMQIWIWNYSTIAHPLIDLMHKNIEFNWQEKHDHTMQELKTAIITSSALIPIDYTSSCPVFLTINSSWHAIGWILSQTCKDGQHQPLHFGSIAWNECESWYSQPKIKLYGLFCSLCVTAKGLDSNSRHTKMIS